jgi:hypothetical protein
MNHIAGYLAHYATFMASRTYLVQDSYLGNFDEQASLNGSIENATNVFKSYNLSMFGIPDSGFSINPANGDAANYYKVGAKTIFEKDMGSELYQNMLEKYRSKSENLSFEAEMWYGDKIKDIIQDLKEIILNLDIAYRVYSEAYSILDLMIDTMTAWIINTNYDNINH